MNNIIEIKALCKQYPAFALKDVSFNVPGGAIVGFVGENGAGKTTTIKAILDIVHKDSGSITLLGQDSARTAPALREDVGVVFDEIGYHNWLRPKQIANILRGSYKNWDDAYYQSLVQQLGLAEAVAKNGVIKDFSRGMKMKYALITALAHHPKLLILDEATSGLDPVVRDEILDLFLAFIRDEEHSILFSSHITSDIERAADYLVFIHGGRILLNAEKDALLARYGVVRCGADVLETLDKSHIVGVRRNEFGTEALIDNRPDTPARDGMVVDPATVDDIMLYTIKGGKA